MSSFKNAHKSNQKQHRERSQPAHRRKLGMLEKKKDYKERAADFQRKQKTLVALKRKALDKNPDEYYFKMVRTRMEEGVHQTEDSTPVYTDEQVLLMQSQDLRYVQHRRSIELKKIEKMKSSLHMLDASDKPKNKHTVFCDSNKEVEDFDAAKYFDTHPSLVNRTHNRLRMRTLKQQRLTGRIDDKTLAEATVERSRRYRELGHRIDRQKQLNIIAQKMQMKKHLADKTAKKKLVKKESKTNAPVYQWVPHRKR